MNRRQFLGLAVASSGMAVSGCQALGYNLSVFKPPTIPGEYIHIEQNTVLDRDYAGVHFIVGEGVTLDLGGHVISGRVGNSYVERAFRLYSGARITNGTIKDCNTGGYAANQLRSGYLDALRGVSKEEAAQVGVDYRMHSSSGQRVDNVTFDGVVGEAFYIQAFVSHAVIEDCEFHNTGRMHIYVDHGSANHKIQNNYFGPCGENHITGREGIALDACIGVEVKNNVFQGAMKNGCVNIYTNWGENGITREVACENIITSNLFRDNPRGVSIASRHYRKAAGHTGPDYAERNQVYDNHYVNIGLSVEDLGVGNQVEAH